MMIMTTTTTTTPPPPPPPPTTTIAIRMIMMINLSNNVLPDILLYVFAAGSDLVAAHAVCKSQHDCSSDSTNVNDLQRSMCRHVVAHSFKGTASDPIVARTVHCPSKYSKRASDSPSDSSSS